MEQIYYTQCPTGYGLGASGGFQIKRKTAGYPVSGDFRHLAYRAFLPGTRTLAPAVLRYRRDDETGAAEVAHLTPRTFEYETERGRWGRPGGHFAHALQLDQAELARLDNWPAGLRAAAAWRRGDPEPSLGREPEPIDLRREDLIPPPDLPASILPALPALLAATARAAREGRTLFLIDEPDRLADRIALLSWAFPSPLRPDLTFSTFHERPEELPGLRLQGTAPAARPNRAALLALGAVADLTSGTIDPPVEVPAWSEALAGWLAEPGSPTCVSLGRRARSCKLPTAVEARWDDAWLDGLVGVEAALRSDVPPTEEIDWDRLAELAAWSARNGLGGDWALRRGASWWLAAVDRGPLSPAASHAFVIHIRLKPAWPDASSASAWGTALGRGLGPASAEERRAVIRVALGMAPDPMRPPLVGALVTALPPGVARSDREWLAGSGLCGRGLLIPFAAPDALAALRDGDAAPLDSLLHEAIEHGGALVAVLDALASGATPSDRERLAEALAPTFELAYRRNLTDVENWPLARTDAMIWAGPVWARALLDAEGRDAWTRRLGRIHKPLRPALARVVLEVASSLDAREPFRWAVEEALLGLPVADRPDDPAWAEMYLSRSSLYSLAVALNLFKDRGLGPWIGGRRGQLEPRSARRYRDAQALLNALAKRRPDDLAEVDLADVEPDERGPLLSQLKRYLGKDSGEAFYPILDRCVAAWPGGFDAGSSGLETLARPLAEVVGDPAREPDAWISKLSWLLDRVGLRGRGLGLEANGLGSEIAAVCSGRASNPRGLFRWRERLLGVEGHWPLLFRDIQRQIKGKSPDDAIAVYDEWERSITTGGRTGRFFEVFFNACDQACDGATFAGLIASRAAELKPHTIPWWDHPAHPGSVDDLRDAFARRAPMAPIELETVRLLEAWLIPKVVARPKSDLEGIQPSPEDEAAHPRAYQLDESHLSTTGLKRWRMIRMVSELDYSNDHLQGNRDTIGRWFDPGSPQQSPVALAEDASDWRESTAQMILACDGWSGTLVLRVCTALIKRGERRWDWIETWPEALADSTRVSAGRVASRRELARSLAAELHQQLVDKKLAR